MTGPLKGLLVLGGNCRNQRLKGLKVLTRICGNPFSDSQPYIFIFRVKDIQYEIKIPEGEILLLGTTCALLFFRSESLRGQALSQ